MAQPNPRPFSPEFWAEHAASLAAVPCSLCKKQNCPFSRCTTMISLEDGREQKNIDVADSDFIYHANKLQQIREAKLAGEIEELASFSSFAGKNYCLKWTAEDVAIGKAILARAAKKL
jgi:hypothetical protein